VSEYVLGEESKELLRLRIQQAVWARVTDAFLDRAGIQRGWRVLDLGCGPGFVVPSLRERVGAEGEVVALDESARWLAYIRKSARDAGWQNVRTIESRVENAHLDAGLYDAVFSRWLFSHLADPAGALLRVKEALRPGGIVAIQDYNLEGLSLFPESVGFQAVVRATRAFYGGHGGDLWIGARLPRLFRQAGLEMVAYSANVLTGAPGSPVFQWAESFFFNHVASMVEDGALTEDERRLFIDEWGERRRNPDTMYFSPIVVDAAARKR
jgi:SAM-dependent methyltransferase